VRQNTGLIDRLLEELQHGLNTCHTRPPDHARPYPAKSISADDLSEQEQNQVAGLMRVNNAGEVAAQGLYRGQALTARDMRVSSSMEIAAEEENEHLNWCQRRLSELNSNRSKLDGVWYWGSFGIGAFAGAIGDKWSLGFVQETEQQVCQHLQEHLSRLPVGDNRSRAILETMKSDEMRHAVNAQQAGAAELPTAIKKVMTLVSKIMTFSAYRI